MAKQFTVRAVARWRYRVATVTAGMCLPRPCSCSTQRGTRLTVCVRSRPRSRGQYQGSAVLSCRRGQEIFCTRDSKCRLGSIASSRSMQSGSGLRSGCRPPVVLSRAPFRQTRHVLRRYFGCTPAILRKVSRRRVFRGSSLRCPRSQCSSGRSPACLSATGQCSPKPASS